jgi:hypothetical protein
MRSGSQGTVRSAVVSSPRIYTLITTVTPSSSSALRRGGVARAASRSTTPNRRLRYGSGSPLSLRPSERVPSVHEPLSFEPKEQSFTCLAA